MKSTFLKSKLHRATITDIHLNYEGSCAVDSNLLNAANILEYEMLHIYNLNNGNRFTTYAIKAEAGSEEITLNGAAAFQAKKDDLIIICTYVELDQQEIISHKPKLVYFKKDTNIIDVVRSEIPIQKAKIVKF